MRPDVYRALRARIPRARAWAPVLAILALDGALGALGLLGLSRTGWAARAAGELALAVLAFHAFAIVHECGHGSLARAPWLNAVVGHLASVLCAVPFHSWRAIHAQHHLWAGNVDRDPTLRGLARARAGLGRPERAALEVSWRLGIPLIALNQLVVVWRHPVARRERVSQLWLVAAYAGLFFFWPFPFPPILLAPAFVLYLAMTELVATPHHLGIPTVAGDTRLKLWEQIGVSRSCHYPRPVAELLFLNFNFHIEHHLFPDLPWYRLREARRRIVAEGVPYREIAGLSWSVENRRRSAVDVLLARPAAPRPVRAREAARGAAARRALRLAGRATGALPRPARHALYRESLALDPEPPDRLVLKLAESRAELEAAFSLLHEAYVQGGIMVPNRHGMRVTKYHLLPTTSTLVAKWDDEVVGTVSLVQDGAFGLPLESIFDVAPQRRGERRLAEISALAVKRELQGNAGQIVFPLLKFLWEYASQDLALDAILAAVNPRMADFYQAILLMEPLCDRPVERYAFANGLPAVGLVLDLSAARRRAEAVYLGKAERKDLFRYFVGRRLPHIRRPERAFFRSFDRGIPAGLVDYFARAKSDLWRELSPDERRTVRQWSRARSPAHLAGSLRLGDGELKLTAKDVSSAGLKATLEPGLTLPRHELALRLILSDAVTVSLTGVPVWNRGAVHGFALLGPPAAWRAYTRYLGCAPF